MPVASLDSTGKLVQLTTSDMEVLDGSKSGIVCSNNSRSLVSKPRLVGGMDNEIKNDGKKAVAVYTERLGTGYGTHHVLNSTNSIFKNRSSQIGLRRSRKYTNLPVLVSDALGKTAIGNIKSARSGYSN
jgi:hypothetical protein